MLRYEDTDIVRLLVGLEGILGSWLAALASIAVSFAIMTSLVFGSKPGDEFCCADVVFLAADEISDFEASIFAILLHDDDPAVILLSVSG